MSCSLTYNITGLYVAESTFRMAAERREGALAL